MSRSGIRTLRSGLVVTALTASLLAVAPAPAAPNQYVTLSDGTSIAINIRCPGLEATAPDPITGACPGGGKFPTIFEMSGYDGGSAQGRTLSGEFGDRFGYGPYAPLADDSRQLTEYFNLQYVTVHASVRGTGCSGGEFDLFSSRSALDGYELIEWIAGQPWSNQKVGIMGHSYGGLTGSLIAATQPPHLTAMTVSGLIDDIYRGIVYPGGVSNYGFPLLWTGGIRNLYDVGGGTLPGLLRPLGEPPGERNVQCARNLSTHRRTVLNDPIVQGLSDLDNDWWRSRSLITYVDRIAVPIHITGAYQDEQTGARGPAHLWEKVGGVPKRLVLTNGDHGTNQSDRIMTEERRAWMDHWMGVAPGTFGTLAEKKTSVRVLFETHRDAGGLVWNAEKNGTSFPLEDTDWQNWYLHSGGGLTTSVPGSEPADTYFSGTQRQAYSYQAGYGAGAPFTTSAGPDELNYMSGAFGTDVAIAGPLTATLYIATTANDTELFVEVMDIGPADHPGTTYLQRGLLKASHRAIDPLHSDYTSTASIYRPFRPHTNPTDVVPGAVNEYLVEIWPVGHIFRAGHRLAVKVTAPPAVDSYYVYLPKRPVGLNTLFHDATRQSRLMVPVVPLAATLGPELGCGGQEGVRCVP